MLVCAIEDSGLVLRCPESWDPPIAANSPSSQSWCYSNSPASAFFGIAFLSHRPKGRSLASVFVRRTSSLKRRDLDRGSTPSLTERSAPTTAHGIVEWISSALPDSPASGSRFSVWLWIVKSPLSPSSLPAIEPRKSERQIFQLLIRRRMIRLLLQMLILQCQLLFQNQSLEQLEEKLQPLLHPLLMFHSIVLESQTAFS